MTNHATILKANAKTLIIDRGRKQAQSAGLSESGPMDEQAFLWANRLLNNNNNDACIEIALGGLSLEFNHDCTIAIAGADMQATLNHKKTGNWLSCNIKKGDRLTFNFSQYGNYSYLAIKGGWQCPEIYSSKSCVLRENLGGHNDGKAISKGDRLHYKTHDACKLLATPQKFQRYYQEVICKIRFIPCYQFQQFNKTQRQLLGEQAYQVSSLADRMGYQLHAETPIKHGIHMISEPIALGSIQITQAGQPIILMRDRQTIGGYPKIGTVIATDIEKLAQCKTGAAIRFSATTIEQALAEKVLRERFFCNGKTLK